MKHSEVDKSISTCEMCTSEFDFGDLRSGQFCDLTMIRQWENVQMPFIPKVRMVACCLSQDIPFQATFDDPFKPNDLSLGRSYEVKFAVHLNF